MTREQPPPTLCSVNSNGSAGVTVRGQRQLVALAAWMATVATTRTHCIHRKALYRTA
jgi:hypothetical protein